MVAGFWWEQACSPETRSENENQMGEVTLVTGGSGFIGSHVARMLAERGGAVVCFDAREPGAEAAWWLGPVRQNVQFVQGATDDWTDIVGVIKAHQPARIIHIAAITNPVLLSQRPALALNVNLAGTLNVLEVVRFFDVGRLVNFSSIGVLPSI